MAYISAAGSQTSGPSLVGVAIEDDACICWSEEVESVLVCEADEVLNTSLSLPLL